MKVGKNEIWYKWVIEFLSTRQKQHLFCERILNSIDWLWVTSLWLCQQNALRPVHLFFNDSAYATASFVPEHRRSSELWTPNLTWEARVSPSVVITVTYPLRDADRHVHPAFVRSSSLRRRLGFFIPLGLSNWHRNCPWRINHWIVHQLAIADHHHIPKLNAWRMPKDWVPSFLSFILFSRGRSIKWLWSFF